MGMVENITKKELIELIDRKFDDCKYTIVATDYGYSIHKLNIQSK